MFRWSVWHPLCWKHGYTWWQPDEYNNSNSVQDICRRMFKGRPPIFLMFSHLLSWARVWILIIETHHSVELQLLKNKLLLSFTININMYICMYHSYSSFSLQKHQQPVLLDDRLAWAWSRIWSNFIMSKRKIKALKLTFFKLTQVQSCPSWYETKMISMCCCC